jgi:hypothetical protein
MSAAYDQKKIDALASELMEPEGMSKGGLVDKLRSAASSVKEAGNVYKAAVGNMFSPFEPTEPQLGDPNDYEFPELRLRRPGIVNLALGMPNMFSDMRYLFGAVKDAATGDEVPDEEWPTFDIATEAQGRYEDDMDAFLRAYTGKSVDELSGPMSAVLGVSEAAAQPGIIPAKLVAGLPRAARYLSHLAEFATPVTVASPGAMLTGAGFNAGLRVLPALTDGDDLEQMNARYSGQELSGKDQARLDNYLQELLGKKDGGLIDRINQGFYENISKPAVGTAIDMTLGLGDLAQMAARYLGNKAGFDAGEFTSVAQPVKEAIGVDDYNPYTIGGVGASILPFAAAGRTAQAINAAPAGVRQLQAALPNLGRESAAYVGAETAGAGAREFMPDSPMAEVLASVAGGMGGSALGSQPTSMGIIKEKGGNWLAGSIEDELGRLHSANQGMSGDTPAKMLAEIEERYPLENRAALPQHTREFIEQSIDRFRSRAQIDNWIDTKLNKYIRNEMATESDPIRLQLDAFESQQAERLAQKDAQIARAIDNMERARLERGRTPEEMTRSQEQIRQLQRERALIAAQTGLHINPDDVGMNRFGAPEARRSAGYPFLAQSKAGEAWEDSADVSIRPGTAGEILGYGKETTLDENPWLAKVPPNTSVYGMGGQRIGPLRGAPYIRSLGFDHMMDELRNATRPDSDLPDNLRINPNNLSKMSVPQIVQKIDEINAYRDVQRIEADALKAFNAATIPHRDYETIPYTNEPNVEGLRWVQIAVPQTLPEDYRVDLGNDGYYGIVDDQGNRSTYGAETEEEAIRMFNQGRENDPLRDALKYEGDAMGHCVGGYCDEVRDGATRIFSLRDARGRPHATVEVRDAIQGISGDILNKIEPGIWNKIIADNGYHDGGYEWLRTNRPDILQKLEARPTQKIEQIKGIRNAAPASQYMPFVQDFVQSGQWSEVGDIQNTGLTRLVPDSVLATAMREAGQTPPEYVTNEELTQLRKQYSTGYAKGGLVYDADAINALANELMEPVRLAGGGAIRKAAEAIRGAAKSAGEALDMSAEARILRAAQQGFNVDEVLYHGTDKSFENFIPKRGLSGTASYLTPDADIASAYAMGDVTGKRRGEGANILPAYVRGNILSQQDLTRGQEIDIWKAIEDYELANAEPGTLKYEMLTDKKFPSMSESLLETTDEEYVPDFVQMMEKLAEIKRTEDILGGLGYTGVRGVEELINARNRPGLREYESIAVFDPKNIRSVNARFNPLDIDSSNILSGLGAGAVGLGALTAQEEREEFAEGGPPRSRIRKAAEVVQAIDSASTANIPARPVAQSAASPESFRLYHGTPHVFGPSQRVRNRVTGKDYVSDPKMVESVMAMMPDQYEIIGENPLGMFDINRIGSGEGAQAYGFGAYGTQLPDVGRGYRQGLLRRHNIPDIPTIAGKPIEDVYSQIERRAGRLPVEQARPEYDKLSIIEQMMIDGDILGILQGQADFDPDALKWFEQEIAPKYERPGALYEMQVNAPQRMFLDWDMPIVDQTPEVQASLRDAGIYDPDVERTIDLLLNEKEIIALDRDPVTKAIRDERRWHDISKQIEEMRRIQPANMTGRQAYYLSAPDARSQAEASEALKRAGIPGIQYLDQGSRGGGEGTRNFVIFDPKMIEILEKYGVAGATTGAGAMAMSGEEEPQEFAGGGKIRREEARDMVLLGRAYAGKAAGGLVGYKQQISGEM